jgi:Putative Actinobacterial Holin-X, holin superfamily III
VSSGTPDGDEDLVALVRKIVDDAMKVARADFELAKAQMRAAFIGLAISLGLIVAALIFLLIAVIDALGALPEAFGPGLLGSSWLGWLVLGGIFLVIAIVLGFLGTVGVRRSLIQGKQTVQTLKEDAEWLRGLTKHSSSGS